MWRARFASSFLFRNANEVEQSNNRVRKETAGVELAGPCRVLAESAQGSWTSRRSQRFNYRKFAYEPVELAL